MKILKSKFSLIIIAIYIVLLYSLSINSKSKLNGKFSKKLLSFSSKKSKDVNIKSFSLDKDSHLIAKCPEKTVLIKIIFEKRIKSNRIDVGFNCRSEPDIMLSSLIKSEINFYNFDDITPPRMECQNNSVFTGLEIIKIKDKILFVWYCGQFRQLGKSALEKSNMFSDEKNKNNDNFDAKKFSEFLIHSDIKVDDHQKQGIFYIRFNRKPSDKTLDYQYGVIDILSNDKARK